MGSSTQIFNQETCIRLSLPLLLWLLPLGHLLSEAGQQMAQLNRRDSSVAFLVKMPQALDGVVHRVGNLLSGHRLEEREKGLKSDASIWASFAVRGLHQLLHVALRRV